MNLFLLLCICLISAWPCSLCASNDWHMVRVDITTYLHAWAYLYLKLAKLPIAYQISLISFSLILYNIVSIPFGPLMFFPFNFSFSIPLSVCIAILQRALLSERTLFFVMHWKEHQLKAAQFIQLQFWMLFSE